jgi:tetratricopeptide (TPR) repeat protein
MYGIFDRRRWILLVIALSCLATLSQMEAQQVVTACNLEEGNRYVSTRQYDEAIAAYQKSLPDCREAARVYRLLGFAYYYSGRPNEASAALTKSREFGEIELHVQLARQYHFEGQHTDELDEVRLARIVAQNDSDLLLALGAACGEADHVDCAEDAYSKVINLKPRDARGYDHLGSVYLRAGQYEKAQQLFQKALKWKPHDPAIYSRLGQAYQALGQTKKAEKAFLHASRFQEEATEK